MTQNYQIQLIMSAESSNFVHIAQFLCTLNYGCKYIFKLSSYYATIYLLLPKPHKEKRPIILLLTHPLYDMFLHCHLALCSSF